MSRKGKLNPGEKVKLVQRCMAGELGVCEAGQQAGVHLETVRRWIAQYEEQPLCL